MQAEEIRRRLVGYADDEVVVEVGGLLYKVWCVDRLNGRFILHTEDDDRLKATRELLQSLPKTKRRTPKRSTPP